MDQDTVYTQEVKAISLITNCPTYRKLRKLTFYTAIPCGINRPFNKVCSHAPGLRSRNLCCHETSPYQYYHFRDRYEVEILFITFQTSFILPLGDSTFGEDYLLTYIHIFFISLKTVCQSVSKKANCECEAFNFVWKSPFLNRYVGEVFPMSCKCRKYHSNTQCSKITLGFRY